jgi:hypothetical protein
LNEIFSTDDMDSINPPLQILDGFYRSEFKLDNDRLIWVLSIDRDGFDRVWVIGAIDIRAEMEFRAHSKSYLKITTWVA